jgi:hypothetical protein
VEGRQAKVDGGGLAGSLIELGELLLGCGEADFEALDFAEPALVLGLADAGSAGCRGSQRSAAALAATMHAAYDGRFILGLGRSAPEFLKGQHGRGLVRALIAAELTEGALLHDGIPVGAILERFEKVAVAESETRHFRPLDPTVVTRLMFGMAFAVALGGQTMYAGATRPQPSPETWIEEMAMLTIHGTLDRSRTGARDQEPG